MSDPIRLVMDVVQRRPACVLLQAAYGGNRAIVSRLFDGRSWLVAPTNDMRMVEGTMEEWEGIAAKVNAEWRRGPKIGPKP